MDHAPAWLLPTLTYLAAAVVAVPLARLLGLGSIIGYLGAGIAIGPFGLAFVTDAAAILSFAEFGVVLMLFLVGLELEPQRLWALRRPIFGWGTLQLVGSTALIAAAGIALGVAWQVALVAGMALAMSSTAIGLGVLNERHMMNTTAGQSVLSVSLFQDIMAIPILALLPLLAAEGVAAAGGGDRWVEAAKAAGMVLGIVFGGRLVLRPALRWIAGSRTPEVFTAAALLLVVATAALMQLVGLSMALGAFLAGVLLAGSEYRRELETDLEPFKGLLMGLFFIAVGMGIDFDVVAAQPLVVAAVVAGFLVVKALVLLPMGRLMPIPRPERRLFTILLAQGGEFGFVVLQGALAGRAVDAETASLLVAAIAISMLCTPFVIAATDRWAARREGPRGPAMEPIAEPQRAPVLILGFGRYGQIVGRMMFATGHEATVLDFDAEAVAGVRRFGWPAFYGDATRLDLLRTAGAGEAKVIVVAVDGIEPSLAIVDLCREHFPQAALVVRARNAQHWYQLHARGVLHIDRETLDSALASSRTVLERLGVPPHEARTQAMRFRRHSIELMHRMAPHQGDEQTLIAVARQGRQQLEELWAQERVEVEARRTRVGTGWHPEDEPGEGPLAPPAADPAPAPPASAATRER
jgi:glutathione-regulated potassium-efflux system ancillary protein KefC